MAFLSDQIDRLSKCTRAINVAAGSIAGPSQSQSFTAAVLRAPLNQLIRPIDDTEIGLFSLADPNLGHERTIPGRPAPELTRIEFQVATPLRRTHTRRDDGGKLKEEDPEVYAHAAFKYIDR